MRPQVEYFNNQNYWKLKKNLIKGKVLFEDPHFKPTLRSLARHNFPQGKIEWKRPKEIGFKPYLYEVGTSSRDLHESNYGNCWFVAAASYLATKPLLWKRVILDYSKQEWNHKNPEQYAGIFHFRFWKFDRWIDVCIDDRLPTVNSQLIYCQSSNVNEFWCALLEKAYAKLHGCYEVLKSRNVAEILEDFTGNISEPVSMAEEELDENPDNRKELFEYLQKAHSREAIIACYIKLEAGANLDSQIPCGLVKGHAYGITDIREVHLNRDLISWFKATELYMIKLQNPWGPSEWKGAWSYRSKQYWQVGRKEWEQMGLSVKEDNQFWMDLQDFCFCFTDIVINQQTNTSKTRKEAYLFSEWSKRKIPCINNESMMFQNPQFSFDIPAEDNLIISFQEEDWRGSRYQTEDEEKNSSKQFQDQKEGKNGFAGFKVFKVEKNRKYRMHDVNQKPIFSITNSDSPSALLQSKLKAGRYIIIPTSTPEHTGRILIRLISDRMTKLRELKQDQPKSSFWKGSAGICKRVTSITVHKAEHLWISGYNKEPDTYVTIECEGSTVKSQLHKCNSTPEYGIKALFYRKHPKRPVTIKVWETAFPRDILLGQVFVAANKNEFGKTEVYQLEGELKFLRSILVETSSSDNLTAI
ncbi:calpain-5-like [Protopterus annectens]|uniref:calpain-5-like n=1 Tax=Protopterus annectens TaxID=7888 RepID=UPI001CFB786F|nr:calpain-5-like [Protopterus annectens]